MVRGKKTPSFFVCTCRRTNAFSPCPCGQRRTAAPSPRIRTFGITPEPFNFMAAFNSLNFDRHDAVANELVEAGIVGVEGEYVALPGNMTPSPEQLNNPSGMLKALHVSIKRTIIIY